jgi:hypothetical protein
MDGGMDGWMGGWMDGWIGGRVDGYKHLSIFLKKSIGKILNVIK